ncbi:uncharacterized protein PGRI_084820 [Penicillium griseofulvum]|uniref:Uncharacterized protein n=1 Tax=Penicillium patulum TaxID=5078 RepID=A0A135LT88_PENPA|nr:uncharacterized protein PGRI_084820 [Penicillium griseofulvum]KXG52198.1 hypothetical protein PGRI_084820 [Penicillium griseofulvum]
MSTHQCEPRDFGDPDVTGFGVLISSGVFILMMLGTVITGYFNRLLREERYNALDNLILDTVYRIFRATGKRDSCKGYEENRIEDFEKFVVTMSDQQLVTGYSLILASYMIRSGVAGLDNTISAYSYCMAVNLALLSCVTHLSSITILRSYHDKSPRLRDARTIVMLVALGFLLPQLVASQLLDSSQTLRCALNEFGGDTTLYWPGTDKYDQTIFFATLAIVGMLVCGYLRRILELYIPRVRESPEAWAAESCAALFSWPSKEGLDKFNAAASDGQLVKAIWLSVGPKGRLYDHFAFAGIILGELRGSFFAEIVWLLFYCTFAICQICFFIVWGSDSRAKQSPISFTPQFGQILPLGMLFLPLLSALELYTRKNMYILSTSTVVTYAFRVQD